MRIDKPMGRKITRKDAENERDAVWWSLLLGAEGVNANRQARTDVD